MIKRIIPFLLGLFLAFLVVGCSSTKSSKKVHFIGNLSEEAYLEEVVTRSATLQQLSAKMVFNASLDGKNNTRLSGTFRLRRNESIQLSIAPLLGIEVGRIEITPQKVMALDRINKRYVELSFSELRALTHADLDFYALQALFLNELFLPNKKELTSRDLSRFEVLLNQQDEAIIQVKQAKTFTYQFFTTVKEGQLKETRIGLANTPYSLQWGYDSFASWDVYSYPGQMRVAFMGSNKPIVAEFDFSRFSTDGNWQSETDVPKRYEKVELLDLLKTLIK